MLQPLCSKMETWSNCRRQYFVTIVGNLVFTLTDTLPLSDTLSSSVKDLEVVVVVATWCWRVRTKTVLQKLL